MSDREPPGANVVHEDASLHAAVQGQEHLRGSRAVRAARMGPKYMDLGACDRSS